MHHNLRAQRRNCNGKCVSTYANHGALKGYGRRLAVTISSGYLQALSLVEHGSPMFIYQRATITIVGWFAGRK